jgi:large subunit ribosomal protein L18|tara:strand:+ start:4022 stop:4528 length:507 start_codon:yes stop_codon:yes gene_type:complete
MKRQGAKSFKRRVEGKTNYQRRLGLLKSRKSRLVVRRSLKNIRVQVVDYTTGGDKIVASAISQELVKLGWKFNYSNTPAAYLTGFLCASRAIKAGKKEAVMDIGAHEPINGCKLYAALKGAVDAGLTVPHNEKALPKEERLNGAHITDKAADIQKSIETIKTKIGGSK